jgi:hypothetical protein
MGEAAGETLAKIRLRQTGKMPRKWSRLGVMELSQNDLSSHVRRNRKMLQWFILGPNSQKVLFGELPAPDLLQASDTRRRPPIYTST